MFADAPPSADLTVDLIEATVQLDQVKADGSRVAATGFLVDAPAADGRPRTVLITAGHAMNGFEGREIRVGWRVQGQDGGWRFAPAPLAIRADDQRPLWTQHPQYDVAAIEIRAPVEFARNAVPLAWLADRDTFDDFGVGPGDEMMTLGYPGGYSSNPAGFPILRTGRVASYPLSPSQGFPTFLLDISAVSGNSGGMVFMTDRNARRPGTELPRPSAAFVAGVLTRQVEWNSARLDLGVVTHAVYVRETIARLP